MTQTTGNSDPRVIAAIKQATELDAQGETDLAVQLLSALINEIPKAASLHGYIAIFLSRNGRLDEAIEPARQAIHVSPKSEKSSLVLFNALWKAEHYMQALDEMKRFLVLEPSGEYSKMINEWNLSEDEPQRS